MQTIKIHSLFGSLAYATALAISPTTLLTADEQTAPGKSIETPASAGLDASDARFLQEVAKSGQTEIQLAMLAQRKAQSVPVRLLAESVVTDHTRSNQELMLFAKNHGLSFPDFLQQKDLGEGGASALTIGGQSVTSESSVPPPASPASPGNGIPTAPSIAAPKSERTIATLPPANLPQNISSKDLANLSGTEFERAFAQAVMEQHEKALPLYEEATKNAHDPEVKEFASRTIPIIRAHLEMAQGALSNVSGTLSDQRPRE